MRIANPVAKQKHKKDSQGVAEGAPIVTEDQPGMPLPHEHDESHGSQGGGPRRIMRQAKHDIERGVVDTDRRGSYGLGEHEGLKGEPKKP